MGGHAAADVLLGQVNPSGKLPVTFPTSEADSLAPCREIRCNYSERLRGGWHVYDGKTVAFPFGHGLSYTSFVYEIAREWSYDGQGYSAAVRVRNSGPVAGREVVQLYVGFPPEEDSEPAIKLKGFQKTPPLIPGQEHDLHFSLTPRDFSVWDSERHNWRPVLGEITTQFGASSRGLRLCGGFHGTEIRPTQA